MECRCGHSKYPVCSAVPHLQCSGAVPLRAALICMPVQARASTGIWGACDWGCSAAHTSPIPCPGGHAPQVAVVQHIGSHEGGHYMLSRRIKMHGCEVIGSDSRLPGFPVALAGHSGLEAMPIPTLDGLATALHGPATAAGLGKAAHSSRAGNGTGQWYQWVAISDEAVEPTTLAHVLRSQASLLVYERKRL